MEVGRKKKRPHLIPAQPGYAYTAFAASKPLVFLDLDFDSDIDDGVDVFLLLHLAGECDFAGFCVTSANTAASGALKAFLQYYDYGDTPMGVNTSDLGNSTSRYDSTLVTSFGVTGKTQASDFESGIDTYRRALANATRPVTIVTTGGLSSLRDLLQSSADGFSSLNGSDLVAAKVGRIYMVAGYWPSGAAVSDMNSTRVAADYVFQNCPVPIDMVGIEIGDAFTTGDDGAIFNLDQGTPMRDAWIAYHDDDGVPDATTARNGWAQPAILAAVRGIDGMLEVLGSNGACTVNTTDGTTSWSPTPARQQSYLGTLLSPAEWKALINGIIAVDLPHNNLLSNGQFTTDLTGWDDDDTGTGASTWNAGSLRLVGTDSSNRARRSQAFAVENGATYRLVWAHTGSNCNVAVEVTKNGADGPVTLTNQTAGTKTVTFVAAASAYRFRAEGVSTGGTVTFRGVSIYKIS